MLNVCDITLFLRTHFVRSDEHESYLEKVKKNVL
jgi:hypothetical protein